MRLLDEVAQSRGANASPVQQALLSQGLSTAAGFSAAVAACPVRYVLQDDLTKVCAALAFSEGDRLAACLDLIFLPARQLWIEWNDQARETSADQQCRRAGMLLDACEDGRRGRLRTFWSNGAGESPSLAALETHVDLDRGWSGGGNPFDGGWARVIDSGDAGVSELMDCLRFRFDDAWADYYRRSSCDTGARDAVLRQSLSAVARDVPVVLAFLLLLNARGGLPKRPIDRSILNHRRTANHKALLLDHIEVHAPVSAQLHSSRPGTAALQRSPPRLHHVRGHLVRRENTVVWRMPHLRGHASRGMIKSRTVTFSFDGVAA